MRLGHLATAAALLLASLPGIASAHEVRPGYLELRQTGDQSWRVLWKVPARGEMRLSMRPRFPANCRVTGDPIVVHTEDAHVERATMECAGGLNGREVSIDGLSATMTDVLVRSVRIDDSVQTARLIPSAPSFVFESEPDALQVARAYTTLGVEHILGGIDHLLFVLALLILVKGTQRLVATITAFTVAHSLTLFAATLGWVHVPGPPVEAAIALSIVFVAAEILHGRRGAPGVTARYPWIVAFTFGLLHGLGFAGALSQVGLPQGAIPSALLCFNVGVEIGQLLFIAAVFAVITSAHRLARRLGWAAPGWLWLVPPYAIGGLASFWVVQRVVAS